MQTCKDFSLTSGNGSTLAVSSQIPRFPRRNHHHTSSTCAFLTDSNLPWTQNLHTLSSLTDVFINALAPYPVSRSRLTRSPYTRANFSGHVECVCAYTPGVARGGLAAWMLTRVLRTLRGVPMPRVEYMDPNLDLAVINNWHLRRGECECEFDLGPSRTAELEWGASVYGRWSKHANTLANKYEGAY